ncbi:MAG: hypothetical protein EOO88_05945 [Pedobacter sp.]|nr:MAG: hypothetical protein EOO88_05945 [Pedobacter sp.]
MINRLIALILLLALVSTNLSGLFIYAEFKANQKLIAAKLCENRDKPQLNCNGKCYLMKKLKDAEEKEKKQEQEARSKSSVDAFVVNEPLVFSFVSLPHTRQRPMPIFFLLSEFNNDILHPPSSC